MGELRKLPKSQLRLAVKKIDTMIDKYEQQIDLLKGLKDGIQKEISRPRR